MTIGRRIIFSVSALKSFRGERTRSMMAGWQIGIIASLSRSVGSPMKTAKNPFQEE